MKVLFALILSSLAVAQDTSAMRDKAGRLASRIRGMSGPDELKADVEIYLKAANWIVRFPEEFYRPEYQANALAVLDRGLARAEQMPQAPWAKQTGRLARAYRSKVDGSLQPYGLVIPKSYDGSKPVRLEVVLHGRAAQMNEVSFLFAHDSDKPIPPEQDFIQLEVFGRTNNAYRWSGETDIFEAIQSVQERYKIDPNR